MTFEGEDFDGLMGYLDAHPAMRAELRRRILDDEFLRLPAEVRELRNDLATLTERVDGLAMQVQALASEMQNLTRQVKDLATNVAEYVGPMYEILFRQKAPSLFGEWLRRPRIVELDDVPGFEALEAANGFTAQELRRLRALDLVVGGMDRSLSPPVQSFLAVEISRTVDLEDVDRAVERAQLLARGGAVTRPAVAGKIITTRARARAEETATLVRLLEDVA